jgi:dethiobiotin synthetase
MMGTTTSGIFVTGTDTGVGKTYVSAGIAEALIRRNVNVGVMKPAETGCRIRAGKLVPKDALLLMQSARVNDPLSIVNPYCFKYPVAPSVAAVREKKTIDIDTILSAYTVLCDKHDFVIVEGAGGIMVPLFGQFTYLDLAHVMRLSVLIVARPSLGTINHTLLSVAALKGRSIPIAGIVINYALSKKPGLAEETSPEVIAQISGIPILGILPHASDKFDVIVDQLI